MQAAPASPPSRYFAAPQVASPVASSVASPAPGQVPARIAAQRHPRPTQRPAGDTTTMLDVVLLVTLAGGACGLGFLLRSTADLYAVWNVGIWLPALSGTALDALALSTTLLIAAIAAAAIRIPGTGTIVALAGLVALYAGFGHDAFRYSWYALISVAGFAAADAVLAAAGNRRRLGTAVVAGVVSSIGLFAWHLCAGLYAHTFRGGIQTSQVTEYFLLPAAVIMVGSVVGSLLATALHPD
ncbi:MAG: hypothetical protein ACJ72E_04170 [Marmoricola sp.]